MSKRVGVVLFQLGGPDSAAAVEPFLYNLFCDPDIIDFPLARIARQPLARLIARSRARHVVRHYEEIGGGSPLLEYTRRQAVALEAELRGCVDARVVIAMRYWHPFTQEAIAALEPHRPEELVLLPLYPQYSRTTTGSSFHEWDRRYRPNGLNVHRIEDYHQDPELVGTFVEAVDRSLAAFPEVSEVDVVFSAHSVPVSVIQAGDPYQRQIERTTELIWERGAWPARKHLCYQSKVGTSKWLTPSLHETIDRLGAAGRRHVLIVPVSFVSDHVETLHEIDIEHRAQAAAAGIRDFRLMPGLNDSPAFIRALARLVLSKVGIPAASSLHC